ncbi:MAG: UDP-glucose 4-epimerase GalE [Rhodocyclaceae bacterium]|nr:UDP-glucose 4-epimerase GalE [Rhodocyclaceae bacterium]MDZ4215950.1 UDP-glucose 4-epimerase GalE [Rhodocyclaceae bacterium]
MRVLVIGGAGYIGSHMVKLLVEHGHTTTVLDSLVSGYRDAVHPAADFVHGDLADRALLERLLARNFDGIMHFASFIQVGESVTHPAKYYRNNLSNSLNLLDAMASNGGGRLIFSSTAAIFGNPLRTPIDETHPCAPINPYGRTKWMFEQALADYGQACGIQSICLRYFNAAGAAPDGSLGERHVPETHLIPLVLQAAMGKRAAIEIFGDDYETPDGTCIRDYIHVMDLCAAHLLALDHLQAGSGSAAYNLGNGQGFSVRGVIEVAERITGKQIPCRIGPRRPGDPPRLVADAGRAMSELGWRPVNTTLESIIADAWRRECRFL